MSGMILEMDCCCSHVQKRDRYSASCMPMLARIVEKFKAHISLRGGYKNRVDAYLCRNVKPMRKHCFAYYEGEGPMMTEILPKASIDKMDVMLSVLLEKEMVREGVI